MSAAAPTDIIINHTTADVVRIPPEWMADAKQDAVWLYDHTFPRQPTGDGRELPSERVDLPTCSFSTEWGAASGQGCICQLKRGSPDLA